MPTALLTVASILPVTCGESDEALRDAWALWLEHEPSCAEVFDRKRHPLGARWHRALVALASETLSAMEEELVRAGPRRGETRQLLEELVTGSRRLCELAGADPPFPVLASTVARARAEVASTRSRLAVRLLLEEGEVEVRTRRHAARISRAVNRALEAGDGEIGGDGPAPTERPASAVIPGMEGSVPVLVGPERVPKRGTGSDRPRAPTAETGPPGQELVIKAESGESWTEMRGRRRRETVARLLRWRPVYREALRPLAKLRLRLAAALGRDSLRGLGDLCGGLESAALRVPVELLDDAPDGTVRADLSDMLVGYAAAGRACAVGRFEEAWSHLVAADRAWRAAAGSLERLESEPTVPPSLLGAGR